jgi:hypothetical protein
MNPQTYGCVNAFFYHNSPSELFAATAAMPSLQELHTAASVNKLPIEDFEDMSLVYPTATKR